MSEVQSGRKWHKRLAAYWWPHGCCEYIWAAAAISYHQVIHFHKQTVCSGKDTHAAYLYLFTPLRQSQKRRLMTFTPFILFMLKPTSEQVVITGAHECLRAATSEDSPMRCRASKINSLFASESVTVTDSLNLFQVGIWWFRYSYKAPEKDLIKKN